jgi:flagellin-like hook-associated protein FlgL
MRISNGTQVNRIQSSINNLQLQLSKAEQQISTGKISSSFSGLKGENARLSIQFREAMESKQSYIDTIKTTQLRAGVTNTALIQIQDLASELRVQLIGQTQDLNVENLPIMNEYAKSQIDRLGNLLNAEVAGRFIFSGDKSGTAPIIDTNTMKANFSAAVNTTVNAGGNSATQIQAAADIFFNDKAGVYAANPFATTAGSAVVTVTHSLPGLVAGDQVTYSGGTQVSGLDLNGTFEITGIVNANTYTITAASSANATTANGGGGGVTHTVNSWNKLGTLATTAENTVRAAVGLDVSYGENANQETFADLFEVLNVFANVSIGAGQKAEYRTLVDNSRVIVEAAFNSINQMIAELGGDQARLESIENNHTEDISLLTTQLGNIEDIDSFEAINRFQSIRAQLESSYQITSASRGFSLVNFL